MSMNPRLSPRMTASLFCGIDRIDTDRTTAANRQDIMLKNKKDKTYLLINMTCTLDTNTSVKTTEKLTKYKDLEIEVERIWGLKTTVPVVMVNNNNNNNNHNHNHN